MNASALLNHLWQSTAFLAAAAALAYTLRRHQARVRFWIWMAASLKFLLPFSLLAEVGSRLRWPAAPVLAPAPALAAISRPFTVATTIWVDFGTSDPTHASLPWLMPLLLALAAAGSSVLLVRWCMQWRRLAGCARRAQTVESQGLQVRLTTEAIEPGVFGIWRPVVLLPERLRRELSEEQMTSVLAHEQCHIRRRDNLWAAMHMLVEALFWFFPPVWWLGGRLVAERERACDEDVLRQGGDRTAYAESLLAVCRYYLESPLRCAAGVSGGGLTGRVRAIVSGEWAHNLSRGRRWVLYGLGALALAGPVAAGLLGAQSAPPPTSFEAASIRPSAPLKPVGGRMMIRVGLRIDPLHLTASNSSLAEMLQQAYNLKPYQLVVPDWMKSERFDIQAVVSQPATRAQMLALLGPYLEKQFGIESHHETKTMPIYALKVAPGGLKAKPAKPGDVPHISDDPRIQAKATQDLQQIRTAQSGPGSPQANNIMIAISPGGAFHFIGIGGMDRLVDILSRQVNKPVLDESGVTGTYDLYLEFTPPAGNTMMFNGGRLGRPGAAPPASPGNAGSNAPTAAAPSPSLFDALKQQMGLELDEGRGPVQLLVVDKANKAPIGN